MKAEERSYTSTVDPVKTPLDSKDNRSLPWDIIGNEYRLLKRACYDPSVRLADTLGF